MIVPYNDMKDYVEACGNWIVELEEYFNKLPENEDIDTGSNPPPPPPPPPGT